MSFKAKHLGVLLTGCLLAGAAQAQENYARIQLGIADADGFSNDGVALIGTFGSIIPQVDRNFSIEAEFSTTVDNPSTTANYGGGFYDKWELSYYTLAGYAAYTYPVNQSVGIYGRAGLLYEDVTVKNCDNYAYYGCVEASESDFGLSFGLGANVAISNSLDFTAGYTVVESDISHLSAGVQFRF